MIGPFDYDGKKRPAVLVKDSSSNITPQSQENEHKTKKAKKDSQRSESTKNEDILLQDSKANLPLAQRLEELSAQLLQYEDAQEKQEKQEKPSSSKNAPTADSLVALLDQALQSNDAVLLEQCLSQGDIEVIDRTTQLLATHRVLQLLKHVVAKLEKRPSRGILLIRWISSILKNHFSYLTTIPDLAVELAALNQLFEQRLQGYHRLSALAGRLDLLMAQLSKRKLQIGNDEQTLRKQAIPETVFED
jgi:hypothetical protein